MSSQPTAATSSEQETNESGIKHTSSGMVWGILLAIILVGIVVGIIMAGRKSRPSSSNSNNMESASNSQIIVSANTYAPIPPVTFEIGDSFSDEVRIPSGYFYNFICNEDYEVKNNEGKIVSAKANTCASLGVFHDEESTANSLLRFRTKKDVKTTMTIEFTPMKLTNN